MPKIIWLEEEEGKKSETNNWINSVAAAAAATLGGSGRLGSFGSSVWDGNFGSIGGLHLVQFSSSQEENEILNIKYVSTVNREERQRPPPQHSEAKASMFYLEKMFYDEIVAIFKSSYFR